MISLLHTARVARGAGNMLENTVNLKVIDREPTKKIMHAHTQLFGTIARYHVEHEDASVSACMRLLCVVEFLKFIKIRNQRRWKKCHAEKTPLVDQ